MNKRQLVERLDRRARERYGFSFKESFLNDLIKDKMISRSKRLQNKGKRPVHFWGRDAYRRGLHIARLVSLEITDRDAQRVFLFLKGYGYPVKLVRRPMLREYVAYAKKNTAGVRSSYVDNTDTVPPGQKERLVKNLGPLEERFEEAGHTLSGDLLISVLRSARQQPLVPPDRTRLLKIIASGDLNNPAAAKSVSSLFAGMQMLGADPNDPAEELDYIEKLILKAPDNAYLIAAERYRRIDFAHPAIRKMLFPDGSSEAFHSVAESVGRSVRDCPSWAVLVFVVYLRFVLVGLNTPNLQ